MLQHFDGSSQSAKQEEAEQHCDGQLKSLKVHRVIRDIKAVVHKADKELDNIVAMQVPYTDKVVKRMELLDSILEKAEEMKALKKTPKTPAPKRKVDGG